MYKKIQILLIIFFSLYFFNVKAQFNTIRPRLIEYVIKKVDTVKYQSKREGKDELTVIEKKENDSVGMIEQYVQKGIKRLYLPLKKIKVTSEYGYRIHPISRKRKFHSGVDLLAKNDKIYSMIPGIVKKVGFHKKGLGNYIVIKNGRYLFTYGHLSKSIRKKGDIVQAGEVIGISGKTGLATGEHLHLSIKYKGRFIDPYTIIEYIKSID